MVTMDRLLYPGLDCSINASKAMQTLRPRRVYTEGLRCTKFKQYLYRRIRQFKNCYWVGAMDPWWWRSIERQDGHKQQPFYNPTPNSLPPPPFSRPLTNPPWATGWKYLNLICHCYHNEEMSAVIFLSARVGRVQLRWVGDWRYTLR